MSDEGMSINDMKKSSSGFAPLDLEDLKDDDEFSQIKVSKSDSLKITHDIMKEIKKSKKGQSATLKRMKQEEFKKLQEENPDIKEVEASEEKKTKEREYHNSLKGSLKKTDLVDPIDEPPESDEEMDESENIHMDILRNVEARKNWKFVKKQVQLKEEELKKAEGGDANELERLRKENEDLKAELEKMKKEIKVKKPDNLRKRIFKKADIKKIIQDKQVVYLNINSFSRNGEHLYNVLRETLPLPVDGKFSLIGELKLQRKKYYFVIHKKLMKQYWYYSHELDQIVKVNKKKQGRKIKKEFRAYYMPSRKFIKKTITLLPKKGYTSINNLFEVGTL